MSDGITNVYNRMNQIRNEGKNLRSTGTPEMVKQYRQYVYQQMQSIRQQNEAKQKGTIQTEQNKTEQQVIKPNTLDSTELKTVTSSKDVYKDTDSDLTKINKTITAMAKKYNISEDLIRAVIAQESGYNKNAVSHAGAQGLMQLMPLTAKSLDVNDSFDIYQNIDGGVKYLRQLLTKYDNDLEKALAAYNAGPHRVDKVGGIPKINETINYVNKIRNNVLSGINFNNEDTDK